MGEGNCFSEELLMGLLFQWWGSGLHLFYLFALCLGPATFRSSGVWLNLKPLGELVQIAYPALQIKQQQNAMLLPDIGQDSIVI